MKPSSSSSRQIQVDPQTRTRPKTLFRLADWQYLERSIHRCLAAWGRRISGWDDKSALHRHVWEQAECVRRLRERTEQFPGGHPDAPVSARLEQLANAVLLAPVLEDALDGIYQVLGGALVKSYLQYARQAHPIHDAPTIQTLHEILTIKEQQRLWFRDYRRRHPHAIQRDYREAVERELAACEDLQHPLPPGNQAAAPAGLQTPFRLPRRCARPPHSDRKFNFIPFMEADFMTNVESRRLFWAVGYLMEKNIPDNQLRWIYDGHFMPWEFHHDISRHLWDESRHGDSGYSCLLDFGIGLEEIGFPPYTTEEEGAWDPLSPAQLYEEVFAIGMIAETGHFEVKNEAYRDFRDGGDLESAEMMLFDIIDETTHVQYAHRWLPVLAKHAGMDNSGYRERSARVIREYKETALERSRRAASLPRSDGNPDYAHYQNLLRRMREKKPLSNVRTCPPRNFLPM